jgi:hypothetical protein
MVNVAAHPACRMMTLLVLAPAMYAFETVNVAAHRRVARQQAALMTLLVAVPPHVCIEEATIAVKCVYGPPTSVNRETLEDLHGTAYYCWWTLSK